MTNTATLNKLVIIGVGLIGGSFSLALRKAGMVKHIVGVGRSKENMRHALKLGAIDEISENDKVTFELEKGMKGMNAVGVKKI